MTNDFRVCNVESVVLHSTVELYRNKEKVETKTCLLSDMAGLAVNMAYQEDISQIYLIGNVLYAETLQRYIREENILHYNNKKDIQVDII